LDWTKQHILVTGGSGFIGSNLCKKLLDLGAKVRCMDNLLTGRKSNIEPLLNHPNFEFFEGDICTFDDCEKAVKSITGVSHQAALGSVPRSIEFPLRTHDINSTGFLNLLNIIQKAGVKRFVYASSSSVYGDSVSSPKREGDEGNVLSPYAVTKQSNENYATVFHQIYGMEILGFRYFNVFGPNQDPNGVYAAAIPKFLSKMQAGEEITINGDGNQTRDFTFVENAVHANILGLSINNEDAFGRVYNVACGESFTLNQVVDELKLGLLEAGLSVDLNIKNGPERAGDIRHSLADISLISKYLGYKPQVYFKDGVKKYIATL
jgi:UDP-N-acetylglucosamine/UDP-N-acetylgalactosamine 4-epimerase